MSRSARRDIQAGRRRSRRHKAWRRRNPLIKFIYPKRLARADFKKAKAAGYKVAGMYGFSFVAAPPEWVKGFSEVVTKPPDQ